MREFVMHARHLWYMARHKWFVLLAGLRLRVPLWRLLIHDWSKFTAVEWTRFARNWAGQPPADLHVAQAHHVAKNPHHWQHWMGREMPDPFVREMVADWLGRGRATHGRWDAREWYVAERDRITLHPHTRAMVEQLLDEWSAH